MTADPSQQASPDIFGPLESALIALCGLTPDVVTQICDEMRLSGLSFGDAAIQLDLITRGDLRHAEEEVATRSGRSSPGLVESALRKISSGNRAAVAVIETVDTVEPSDRLIFAHNPYDPRSEKIRALRTEILLRMDSNQSCMLAMLSPARGDGRTQLAAELAIAFAQLGSKTLLVDADLRQPLQHELFACNNERGLSSILVHGERPFLHRVSGLPQMHLLTAGPSPINPLELLSGKLFEHLMSEWRRAYNFVVIDTPAISECSDGLAVAANIDHTLIITRAQHTTFKATRTMLRQLSSTQSAIVGAVINHF